MFSVNLKLSNKRIAVVLLIFVATVVFAVALRLAYFEDVSNQSVECNSQTDIREYLQSFGLDVGDVTVDEITVPHEFSDVYSNYNEIQRSQGFDLSEHKGKTLKRYTFSVNNHPDGEHYFAEVLMLDNTVVGADIYSTELDGSISPLK